MVQKLEGRLTKISVIKHEDEKGIKDNEQNVHKTREKIEKK